MIPDYHIHTGRCGHASGGMRQYADEAVNKGLGEIGFSDHIPMYWLPSDSRDPGLAMAEEQFPGYVAEVLGLKSEFSSLSIRLGVEVDYIPGRETAIKPFLLGCPFDYVIGSVHYIDGWGFDNPALLEEFGRQNIDEIYEKYFDLLCAAASSRLFDIIAHPDLIKKFGHRPAAPPLELYRRAAVAMAGAGVCVEVNTAGLRVPAEEIYPSLDFLRICRLEGVPASTGSDAHAPGLVGAGFSQAADLLREAGYREVAVFKGRTRNMIKI
ncbi:MAG: histidinol phosphatase [Peptococcaceae bacterium BICA1-7]|nr:MAG: histidinol phosphatase [Peptococcaceae bacterium BICA1-7]HBV99013.1 PHP domain-containing protein [Desulfotomaculum sp.]